MTSQVVQDTKQRGANLDFWHIFPGPVCLKFRCFTQQSYGWNAVGLMLMPLCWNKTTLKQHLQSLHIYVTQVFHIFVITEGNKKMRNKFRWQQIIQLYSPKGCLGGGGERQLIYHITISFAKWVNDDALLWTYTLKKETSSNLNCHSKLQTKVHSTRS